METNMLFQYNKDEFRCLLKEILLEILAEDKIRSESQATLINIQEAAALLNLAVNTIYEKTSAKLIPHYKHGKKIMFKKSELLAWVESRRVKTIHEIRKEATIQILKSSK
jgi:excisionase family DNA binding protein